MQEKEYENDNDSSSNNISLSLTNRKLKLSVTLTILVLIFFFLGLYGANAKTSIADITVGSVFIDSAKSSLEWFVEKVSSVLFYPVFGFPVLVLWLVAGGIFFTIKLGFINFRLFAHAIDIVKGKYSKDDDPGEVTHFQALVAAVSGTVGLGNIAGVAIAVSLGGPGAVVWMAIAGLFGMSTKFAEVTLGVKYRKIGKNGKVSGGAFHYLKHGLAEIGMPRIGKALAVIFAILCVAGSLGGGNMFQANQTVAIMTHSFAVLHGLDLVIAVMIMVSVGTVLIGGIKRIAMVAEAVVPIMAFIYISSALIVLIINANKVPDAVILMFQNAFDIKAMGGGMLGAIIAGFKRATFSNEAGLGSAPIAHSAAKTAEPVREGCVALLEPFIDTVVICFLTGCIITVTGVYQTGNEEGVTGVILTSRAFATVIDWFPIVLSFAVVLFAYSTMITWSYYGERAWEFLFGRRSVSIFHVIFCSATFLGGVVEDINLIVEFCDLLLFSMAVPNIIGLYFMSGLIKAELTEYLRKLKHGEFVTNL